MTERSASSPFEIVSQLDSFKGTGGYRLHLVDGDGKVLGTDDPRLIDLNINVSELKVERPSPDGKVFAFSSPNRKSELLAIIDPYTQEEVMIDRDGELVSAYKAGSQADFWFKEPCVFYITLQFNKQGIPILQERRFKNGTEDITVVAVPIT